MENRYWKYQQAVISVKNGEMSRMDLSHSLKKFARNSFSNLSEVFLLLKFPKGGSLTTKILAMLLPTHLDGRVASWKIYSSSKHPQKKEKKKNIRKQQILFMCKISKFHSAYTKMSPAQLVFKAIFKNI